MLNPAMIEHVIVGLDGSPLGESSLPFVEGLATKLGSRVTLLHVTPVPEHPLHVDDYPPLDQIVQRATQYATQYLEEHRRRLATAGVDARVVAVSGRPAEQIVACADRQGADLIALATHGRSGIGRLTHGSVAERVLHTTTKPLLLVHPDDWPATPRGLQRIMVPLDGSPEAETALGLAEPIAVRCRVPLELVHFVEPLMPLMPEVGGPLYMDLQAIVDGSIAASRGYIDKMVASLRKGDLEVSGEVAVAHPAEGIANRARQRPGTLVVLSTHGRSGWRRLLLGSVAQRAVQLAPGAVLVCPAPAQPASQDAERTAS
jgi:nucleotide-binding universal stress UspA family protein